jgi:hypothetical protein
MSAVANQTAEIAPSATTPDAQAAKYYASLLTLKDECLALALGSALPHAEVLVATRMSDAITAYLTGGEHEFSPTVLEQKAPALSRGAAAASELANTAMRLSADMDAMQTLIQGIVDGTDVEKLEKEMWLDWCASSGILVEGSAEILTRLKDLGILTSDTVAPREAATISPMGQMRDRAVRCWARPGYRNRGVEIEARLIPPMYKAAQQWRDPGPSGRCA